jgi:hypothetical protein
MPEPSLTTFPVESTSHVKVEHSSESINRAASEHDIVEVPLYCLPERTDEQIPPWLYINSDSTRSYVQVAPPGERRLPNEILAAPLGGGSLEVESSSQPATEQEVFMPSQRVPTRPHQVSLVSISVLL